MPPGDAKMTGLDRIDFSFDIPTIHMDAMQELHALRRQPEGYNWEGLNSLSEPVMTFEELEDVWEDVPRVDIPRRAQLLGGMLTDALRLCIVTERSTARPDFDLKCERCQFHGEICSHLLTVPGQRVTNSLFRLAQALAWFEGEVAVGQAHLLAAFPWVLAHRLDLRPEHERTSPSRTQWIREVGLGEILRPKLPTWNRALNAFEEDYMDTLDSLSENDLVVRMLLLMARDNRTQATIP